MIDKLGFVGFGEVAYHLTKGLRSSGVARTFAYDINTNTPRLGEKIRARARETSTELADSSAELAAAADIIISAVTADQAVQAAAQTAPYLAPRHIYADLNSISPASKQAVCKTISAAGARFVEIAVMAAVPPYGHKVPMLLGGAAAPEFLALFTPHGMKMEVVSTDQIGRAVAVKMCRSIVYKGLEAILFECVLGASQYGAEERVFQSLDESFPGMNWKALADYMIGRVVVHGERRAREMDEVARTLEELGVEPMMASATARRMDWAAALGLREKFGGEFPETYQKVLEAIAEESAANAP
jgi:3-hydroxyisobutyrate dehydrogenase-like beta-hydroxyacid dehydrogenase